MKDLEQTIISLRNLAPYSKLSDEKLREIAIAKLEEKKIDEDLDVGTLFSDREDKKLGKRLLKKYLNDYVIESISDKNTLMQLIYLEVIHTNRLQRVANDQYKEHQVVPRDIVDNIHKNLTKILELKDSLRLIKGKDAQAKSDTFKALETLKKKFKVWREDNQGSRTIRCPHENCGKMIMLKIRTDSWEAQRHPYFKDKLLGNTHLMKLFKEGKVTREDVAKILQTSPDYTDWLLDKWGNIKHD